jgi:hypothetical protein
MIALADGLSRGDPYTAEVAATVHAVMTKLGFSNPYAKPSNPRPCQCQKFG